MENAENTERYMIIKPLGEAAIKIIAAAMENNEATGLLVCMCVAVTYKCA